MPKSKLFSRLERPGANFQRVAQEIATQPALLAETFTGLGAKKARIKYGCAKVLRLISEGSPHALYPFFDRFVALCESENKILQWTAIIAIGNMAPVDAGSRIEMILDQYLGLIRGPVMITAANTIRSAAKIALAKPQLADRIARGILEVETARYQTAECRNVALGHAIASLQLFFPSLHDREPVLAMARRQLRNTRNATRQKATRFLALEERAAA